MDGDLPSDCNHWREGDFSFDMCNFAPASSDTQCPLPNWCKNWYCLRVVGTSINCLIDAKYLDCRPMVYEISAGAKYVMEMRVPVQNDKMSYWYVYWSRYIVVTRCYRPTGISEIFFQKKLTVTFGMKKFYNFLWLFITFFKTFYNFFITFYNFFYNFLQLFL